MLVGLHDHVIANVAERRGEDRAAIAARWQRSPQLGVEQLLDHRVDSALRRICCDFGLCGNSPSLRQTAVFALTREIGRHMIARRSGAIVMISSMASHYGIPGVIAYTAAKSAVEGMTRALAVEWSPFGVRVNCIAPGFIATPMSARALDTDAGRKSRVLARTPMGKLGEPADVAEAVLFLSSARARYITGVILPVDGGNSIGF